MAYEHTQTSPVRPLMVLGPLLCFVVMAVLGREPILIVVAALFFGALALVLWVASKLTVTVTPDAVHAAFGSGWPKRRVATADIASAVPVRNRWFYGWGIRLISQGWMYNVWGLDAVDLELRSGRHFRIGTDQPTELAAAIEQAIEAR